MVPFLFGIASLPYWIFFCVFLLFDLYLSHPTLGIAMRLSFWPVLLLNIAGIVLSAIPLTKGHERQWLWIAGLIFNILPLIGIGGLFVWLFFDFKM